MKFLWNYLKEYKLLLALILVLAIINQVFSLLDPQIFRLIIDNYATNVHEMPKDVFIQGVVVLILAAIGVAFISRTAKNFQDYYVNVITQRIGTKLYAKSVDHTLELPYSVFEDSRSGEILQKLQKARMDTQILITSLISILFLSIVGMGFVITYAFMVHPYIGFAYVALVPILGIFAYVLSKKIKAAQKDIVKKTSELAGSTTETLRNVELVKSLGLEKEEIKRLNISNEKILELELIKVKLIRKNSFLQGTAINATRSILLFLMLYLVYLGDVSLGELFTLFIYSFFIFGPVAEFATLASQYQEAKASNEQLDQILKIPKEKKPLHGKIITQINTIQFDKVSFSYASSTNESLKGISFIINRGDTVAFAGPSGSGKSTIIKLLVGLYSPNKGELKINSIKREHINYDTFRSQLGFVSQETQLFAGTIKENLLFSAPHATDVECYAALKDASALSILERSKDGINTKIGEGGIKVSGGERQRIAIARALIRKPSILIFDEATSALDSITEKAITQTIKDIRKTHPEMIIVMVAHRLSTIAHADTIYVLEKGHIKEFGTHRSLIKKKGLYEAFYREQSSSE